jgi:hypothetical protein
MKKKDITITKLIQPTQEELDRFIDYLKKVKEEGKIKARPITAKEKAIKAWAKAENDRDVAAWIEMYEQTKDIRCRSPEVKTGPNIRGPRKW